MRRSPLLAAAAFLALAGTVAATAPAAAGDGPHGAAHALSVRTTLLDKPLVTVDPLPAVTYPEGGEKSLSEVGPDAGGLLTAKALHASSRIEGPGLASRASIVDAVVKDLLRAAVITAECHTEGSNVVGSSSIADLTVLGQKINVQAGPTPIDVLGVATVRLDEQVHAGNTLTVNAVRVTVNAPVGHLVSAEVILSQVKCSATGPVTQPSTPTTPGTTTTPATDTTTPTPTATTATDTTSTPGQPTGTATATTTTSDDVAGIVPAANSGDLADTGASGVVMMALIAAALLVGGVGFIVFSRRRRGAAGTPSD